MFCSHISPFSCQVRVDISCLVAKVNSLSCISQSITGGSREVILPLCTALVRLHLECYVHKRDMDLLKQIQHITTRMTARLEHLSYKERPRELGLFSLEKAECIPIPDGREWRGGCQALAGSIHWQLKPMIFHLNTRKHFFSTIGVVKH